MYFLLEILGVAIICVFFYSIALTFSYSSFELKSFFLPKYSLFFLLFFLFALIICATSSHSLSVFSLIYLCFLFSCLPCWSTCSVVWSCSPYIAYNDWFCSFEELFCRFHIFILILMTSLKLSFLHFSMTERFFSHLSCLHVPDFVLYLISSHNLFFLPLIFCLINFFHVDFPKCCCF